MSGSGTATLVTSPTTTLQSRIINGYCTLAELKASIDITSTDTVDDAFIESLVTSSSRFIDRFTRRTFYPRIETRYFNVPADRYLYLDDDLLTLTTLTNGDDDVITSSDYILLDKNFTPYWGVKLRDTSDITWEVDSNSSAEQVLDVTGWWGYHNDFTARAWYSATTLAEALDTSEVAFDMTSAALFGAGTIFKVGNEIFNVLSVASNTVTVVKRADNGSTAAAHDTATAVYIWQPMDDIKQVCLEMVLNLYKTRYGANRTGASEITAAGVVITPKDLTEFGRMTLNSLQRI